MISGNGSGFFRTQLSFAERVDRFWSWFPTKSERIAQALDDGDVDAVMSEVQEFTAETLPRLAWVFGPETRGHSFTLTGEGQKSLQYLAEFWHSRAVELPGWTFYASRQASSLDQVRNMAIEIDEAEVAADEIRLVPDVDPDDERVHISAWHPAFADLEEGPRLQILFLLLDEVLGEFGTQLWIGEINFAENNSPITLLDLPDFLDQVEDEYHWEKLSPLEEYCGYQADPEGHEFPRGDTIAGFTSHPDLLFEYLSNQGSLEDDPLEGTGAEFLYLAIETDAFPLEDALDVRDQIEAKLGEQLEGMGRIIGAASGTRNNYLDLIVFDRKRATAVVDRVMDQWGFTNRYQLQPFMRRS